MFNERAFVANKRHYVRSAARNGMR